MKTDWPTIRAAYAAFKSEYGLTDGDMEALFGLKPGTPPGNNFRSSSAYKRMVRTVVEIAAMIENKKSQGG